jgi:hypothetical protein
VAPWNDVAAILPRGALLVWALPVLSTDVLLAGAALTMVRNAPTDMITTNPTRLRFGLARRRRGLLVMPPPSITGLELTEVLSS